MTSTPYSITGSSFIDVTTNGYRWYFPSGQSQTLNWSVSSSKWSYQIFQSSQTQTNFAKIFEGIEEFINVDFKFLGYFKGSATDAGYVVASKAGSDVNITAAYNGKNSNGVQVNDNVFSNTQVLGRAFFPDSKLNNVYQGAPGDVWLNFNNPSAANSTFNMGSAGYTIVLHEILHGLGLKHPHDDGGTGRPTYASLDAKFLDRQWVSVMSYDAHENGGDGSIYGSLPIGPMLLDGIALQFLFGESNFNSGDTKYDLSRYLGNYYNCQWDASGIDTLDGSKLTYGISVELGTGLANNGTNTHHYGFVTTAIDQLYLQVLGYNPSKWTWLWGEYENVNGTAYADNIVGNDLSNVINGGDGNDYLYGGDGNDTFDWDVSLRGGNDYFEGGDGDDIYVIDSYYDEIVELSNEGIDTVYVGYNYSLVNTFLENIRTFTNQTAGLTFTGNAWGNEIDGGQGGDTLIGNAGNDTLSGNAGNDLITGGSGNDVIDGGEGSDTVTFANNFNNYSIKFNTLNKNYSITANAGTDGVDTFVNIEFLRFADRTLSVDSLNMVFDSYTITPQLLNVDEGAIATFNVTTTKINSGTILNYTIAGVSSSDVSGGLLSGNVTIGSDGTARILVGLLADYLTEGAETLIVTAQGKTASVLVNDTSKTTLLASYALSPSTNSVSEGSNAVFTLTTTNVAGGTFIPYTISGVSSADITGGALSGTAIVSSTGNATITIPLALDLTTEGTESLTVTAQGISATISIIDTSTLIGSTTTGISITRGPSNDLIQGSRNNDSIDGGAGTDTLLFTGNLSNYTITYNRALGAATVTDRRSAGDGIDSLTNIEKLQFADKTIELISPPLSSTPAYGKTPSFLFDPVYYLLKNPELIPTVSLANAYSSYMQTGATAGEAPNNWFDAAYYSNKWSDLKPLNLDAATLFTHYNLYGVWEGRSAGPMFDKFDGTRYLRENPDVGAYVDAYVKDFLGSRINGAIAHYIIYGANESRKTYDTLGQLIDTSFTISTPTYNLTTVTPSVNEGSTASFNLTYVNATVGTEVGYTLSGINASDVTSGSLTGKVLIGASGQTTINIPISSDAITEGQETLTLSIKGVNASTVINDTSKGNAVPTYTLTPATTSINEGELAQVYVSTTNVTAGTVLQYRVSGVSANDLIGGLNRQVTVDPLGQALFNIQTNADQITEGPEIMYITLGTSTTSLIINDTSVALIGVIDNGGGN